MKAGAPARLGRRRAELSSHPSGRRTRPQHRRRQPGVSSHRRRTRLPGCKCPGAAGTSRCTCRAAGSGPGTAAWADPHAGRPATPRRRRSQPSASSDGRRLDRPAGTPRVYNSVGRDRSVTQVDTRTRLAATGAGPPAHDHHGRPAAGIHATYRRNADALGRAYGSRRTPMDGHPEEPDRFVRCSPINRPSVRFSRKGFFFLTLARSRRIGFYLVLLC
jgi:hypothetical protein